MAEWGDSRFEDPKRSEAKDAMLWEQQMSKGRDQAESVSEAKAQSESGSSDGGGCFLMLARLGLLVVLAIVVVAWGS